MAAQAGDVIARKQFDFSDNRTVPVYTLDLLREGYREGIRHDAQGWRMIRRESTDAATKTEGFKYLDEAPTAAKAADTPQGCTDK